jgi:predicted nucleotide-binding protein
MRPRVLFQGSYHADRRRKDGGYYSQSENADQAKPIAEALGKAIINGGFDLMLTGSVGLSNDIGVSAVAECERIGQSPRERIRTIVSGSMPNNGFGMVLRPAGQTWQEARTFVVQETDAVVALIGGKGTSDCLQKAALANKPVFPIPRSGGAGKLEWDRLRAAKYRHAGGADLEFLGDQSIGATELAAQIVAELARLLMRRSTNRSRRIFIVHGHDGDLKNHLARLLQTLDFSPIILAEQPEKGQALINKLNSQLSDIAYAFILYTGDDHGSSLREPDKLRARTRQNVVFEHGLLLGLLGNEGICVIVRGDVELPSDLKGLATKTLPREAGIESIAFEIAKELSAAGYQFDANRLLSLA